MFKKEFQEQYISQGKVSANEVASASAARVAGGSSIHHNKLHSAVFQKPSINCDLADRRHYFKRFFRFAKFKLITLNISKTEKSDKTLALPIFDFFVKILAERGGRRLCVIRCVGRVAQRTPSDVSQYKPRIRPASSSFFM